MCGQWAIQAFQDVRRPYDALGRHRLDGRAHTDGRIVLRSEGIFGDECFRRRNLREQSPFGALGRNAVACDSDAAGEYPRVALRDLGSRRIDMGCRRPRVSPGGD